MGLEYDGVVTRGYDHEFMYSYEAHFHALDPYVIGLPDIPCVVTHAPTHFFRGTDPNRILQ